MKKIFTLVLIIIALNITVSSCMTGTNLDERAIVKAIYLDENEKGTIQASLIIYTCKPSANTADVQGEPALYTGQGDSIASAIANAESKQNKHAFFEQNRIVLLGTGAFNNISNYLSYFASEQTSGANYAVFLTKVSNSEFSQMQDILTNIVQTSESVSDSSIQQGNKSVKIYETDFSQNKFNGYLPVLTIEDNTVKGVEELLLFENEIPIGYVRDVSMQLLLVLSGKKNNIETSFVVDGTDTIVQTQQFTAKYKTNENGKLIVILSGKIKSILQNGQALHADNQQKAIEEFNKLIEQSANLITDLTINRGNDVFQYNNLMYNNHNRFCESVTVISNFLQPA